MKKTLVIHIGANKTGTTSIQKSLDDNKEKLREDGVLYPSAGKIWNGHFKLAWGLGAGSTEEKKNSCQACWKDLREEVLNNDECALTVISSENFLLVKNEEQLKIIKDLFHDFIIKIVFYIRRQDFWVESLYLQAIKMGVCSVKFSEYCKKPGQSLDFNDIIKPWLSLTDKSNIMAYDFDKEKSNLLEGFYKNVLNSKYVSSYNRNDNQSLDRGCAEFLIKYKEIFPNQLSRNNFINFYNNEVKELYDIKNVRFFSEFERLSFYNNFKKSNDTFFNNYMKGAAGFNEEKWPDGIKTISNKEFEHIEKKVFEAIILKTRGIFE